MARDPEENENYEGDPRRCPVHPNQVTSSPDGMFDAPCPACEWEMEAGRYEDENFKEEFPTTKTLEELPLYDPTHEDEDDIPF